MLVPFILSSCLDYTQEITIENDGSARLYIYMGIDLGEEKIDEVRKEGGKLCDEMFENTKGVDMFPGVTYVEIISKPVEKIIECEFIVEVDDFTVIKKLHTQGMIPILDFSQSRTENQKNFSLVKEQDKGKFNQTIVGAGDGGPAPKDPEFEKLMKDKTIKVIIHAPRINSTNGELSKSRKTVVWERPFKDLFLEKNLLQKMNADFEFNLMWYQRVMN